MVRPQRPRGYGHAHYAARILDYSDKITRKSLPSLGPLAQPAADNVVKLQKR